MMYYVYEKATGRFMGSGTVEISDEQYASTITAPSPDISADPSQLYYDDAKSMWINKADQRITDLEVAITAILGGAI